MKARIHIFLFFGFVLLTNTSVSQFVNAQKISAIAFGFEEKDKYENAIYYYKLALFEIKDDLTSLATDYRTELGGKINELTKDWAYTCRDSLYIRKLLVADSLMVVNQYVQALFQYEQAYRLQKRYEYPLEQVAMIKKKHPEVRTQIAIFNATQKRLTFDRRLTEIKERYKKGGHLYAYYSLWDIKKEGHENGEVDKLIDFIEREHNNEIIVFEDAQCFAEELYLIGLYEESLDAYEDALIVFPECTLCKQRIADLPVLIENATVSMFSKNVDPKLAKKIKKSKLSLMKANKYFRADKYIQALKIYKKIRKKRLLEAEHGVFIEERIALSIKKMNT